ncbi:MAG: sarcosine oxidase subunit gamma family protein [Paralcaligenes sp.]
MQTEIVQESPLVGVQGLLAGVPSHLHAQVRIEEMPFLELNNIRGNSASPEFVQAIGETLDVALPIKANTVSIGTEYVLWWLGPNEWLAQSVQARPAVLEARLRGRFGDQFATSVDVGSGYTTLRLSGTHAGQVLQKGCPLDLHPKVFTEGQCAQSYFFKSGITLRPQADGAWVVIVRRSFADYAVRMMLDAAHEFYL